MTVSLTNAKQLTTVSTTTTTTATANIHKTNIMPFTIIEQNSTTSSSSQSYNSSSSENLENVSRLNYNTSGNSTSSSTPTSSTALRRLHFKTARNLKPKTSTAKILLMGSSTTSDVTINTSTESASTMVTNITATDTDNTMDSLDCGDISGQSEPLLSLSLEDNVCASLPLEEDSTDRTDITSIAQPIEGECSIIKDIEEIPLKQLKAKLKTPQTVPLAKSTHFVFPAPSSPKSVGNYERNQSLFTFELDKSDSTKSSSTIKSVINVQESNQINNEREMSPNRRNFFEKFFAKGKLQRQNRNDSEKNCSLDESGVQEKVFEKSDIISSVRVQQVQQTMNYDVIENDIPIIENPSVKDTLVNRNESKFYSNNCNLSNYPSNLSHKEFNVTAEVYGPYVPLAQTNYTDSDSKLAYNQHINKSKDYGQMSSVMYNLLSNTQSPTSPPFLQKAKENFNLNYSDNSNLDIRNETGITISTSSSSSSSSLLSSPSFAQNDEPYNENAMKMDSFSSTGGLINVTPNPMDTTVYTLPRATIVVQQASLSLDNSVETYLLKNENDFISVEQGKNSSNMVPGEENMRQLLDVTNKFTLEEIRDFEMRYGSPHHNRSQSVKTPGSRASGRPNQLLLPQQRSRVASMPNTGVEEEFYRLRHFSITGKGVINRGDSLKSRRCRSNNSVASSNSSTEHLTAIPAVSSVKTSATSSRESSTSNPGASVYRVVMLGGSAVGKSSLVSQFMTSEYLHAYDTSIDDDTGEKSVSVLLGGEESELTFIDHSFTEKMVEDCFLQYEPHGYCVIYSSADRSTFLIAEQILQTLWTSENIAQKAVILVANKADLARSRVVTADEGKSMATAYDCKFIETSVGINHNVDELLVGILSQIRLKLENPEKSRDLFRKRSTRKSRRRACSPLGIAAPACLSGNGGTNTNTPISNVNFNDFSTPPGSAHSSPRKYRGSRTSASLRVKGLLGRVWARDSKSKSCENLHVL